MRGALRAEIPHKDRPNLHVFLIRGTAHDEYVIEVPPTLTAFTLVVDGQAVLASHAVDHDVGEDSIRVR